MCFNIDSLDSSDKIDQDLSERMMVLSKPADAPVQKLFDLSGKVVAITGRYHLLSIQKQLCYIAENRIGGARGIGLAVATAYAEAGAKVPSWPSTTRKRDNSC